MLIMIYTSNKGKPVKAEVVKYTDRIWFDASGDAQCLRSVIFHVLGDSPASLSEIFFLAPVPKDDIKQPEDKSETCLLNPDDFYFNSIKTNGYEVKEREKEAGVIFNDGFGGVTVKLGNKVDCSEVGSILSVIRVKLREPVQHGEFREIRLSFLVSALAEKIAENTYTISLPYFTDLTSLRDFREAVKIVKGNTQIPAVPIYNKETKMGGFDVFLYLPPGKTGYHFQGMTKSMDKHDVNGEEAESREKYIWRMHEMTSQSPVTLGREAINEIKGDWSGGLTELGKEVKRHGELIKEQAKQIEEGTKVNRWAFRIGILAFLAALAAIYLAGVNLGWWGTS